MKTPAVGIGLHDPFFDAKDAAVIAGLLPMGTIHTGGFDFFMDKGLLHTIRSLPIEHTILQLFLQAKMATKYFQRTGKQKV